LTYLDHIKGKKHQRYLGYSMRIEKSMTEEVNGVLSWLAEKKWEREGGGSGVHGRGSLASEEALDFEEVARSKDDKALWQKAKRARRWEERKPKEREQGNGPPLLNAVEDKNAKEIGAPVRDEPVKDKDEEDEVWGIHPQTSLPWWDFLGSVEAKNDGFMSWEISVACKLWVEIQVCPMTRDRNPQGQKSFCHWFDSKHLIFGIYSNQLKAHSIL
jgi:hypothetical protein